MHVRNCSSNRRSVSSENWETYHLSVSEKGEYFPVSGLLFLIEAGKGLLVYRLYQGALA